ncbi:polysaccharide deacetylase family protein [Tabrizicola sp. WMC-M-20]|nr:polysaccharide deacetylase family protein [Tabrizicola sp. WMC-M-20]
MAHRVGIIFHGIGMPGRTLEPGEAPYWVSEARFLQTLDQIAAFPDHGRIRISFDDGNASDHAIALPALQARGLTADFFVLSGRIGLPGSLSEAQILSLRDAGMTVGSHGIAHLPWPRLTDARLRHELTDSRQSLEALLAQTVDSAGIPFGAWNGRVLKALRAAGYRAAWSSDCGMMDPAAFLRPRTSITAEMTPDSVSAALSGRLGLRASLRRAAGMLAKRMSHKGG